MTFIEDYRKILLSRIKDYHWNDIQIEIESFFIELQRANFPRQDCLNKFIVSKPEILEKFSQQIHDFQPKFTGIYAVDFMIVMNMIAVAMRCIHLKNRLLSHFEEKLGLVTNTPKRCLLFL